MNSLDMRSPFAAKRGAALKNILRARRAHATLVQAYCDTGSAYAWKRLGDYEKTMAKLRARWESIDAAHRGWIDYELSAMTPR